MKKQLRLLSILPVLSVLSITSLLLPDLLSPSLAHAAKPQAQVKSVRDLNDNVIEIPNKAGKWTVVNYFTEWCGPCKREIPDLNAFYKNNQDKIVLVGVNSDLLDYKSLQKMIKNMSIDFPILQNDPMKMVGSLEGTPSTYLISPAGEVHGPLLGPQSEKSLLRAIKRYS